MMQDNREYPDRVHTGPKPVRELFEIDDVKFKEISQAGEPVVMRSCSFGDCTNKWTLDYLTDALGDKEIIIHESKESYSLDFLQKNFIYKKCKFSEFAQKLRDTHSRRAVYLRSINKDPKRAARIEDDFPILAADLKPPSFIPYGQEDARYHSSVLRVSSRFFQLWIHFDLLDNVLFQVAGVKTVYLFPPSDSQFLYLNGDKSPIQGLDNWSQCTRKYPDLAEASPLEAHLHPGDCLYIPSMWWHQILVHEDHNKGGHSIGFNIFWKEEELEKNSLYAPNDPYGNKDLSCYSAALDNLNKAMKHLEKLPGKYGCVYREMFYREVRKRLEKLDTIGT